MGSLMLWILQILSGLYIGNFRDSKDLKQLDIHKITHILSIHDDARKLFKARTTFILLQNMLQCRQKSGGNLRKLTMDWIWQIIVLTLL